MTVKELIEELKKYPEDTAVMISGGPSDGGIYDIGSVYSGGKLLFPIPNAVVLDE